MPTDPKKIQALRSCGALNHHPEKVRHSSFAGSDFFDPHDLVQLKYETLRAVEIDGQPIAQASSDFGLSRPTIYQAQENFRQNGVEGLLPRKRGPKNPRKLTREVFDYMREERLNDPHLKPAALARRIQERFGVLLHPRTLEKALAKKGRQTP
jgi:transposase